MHEMVEKKVFSSTVKIITVIKGVSRNALVPHVWQKCTLSSQLQFNIKHLIDKVLLLYASYPFKRIYTKGTPLSKKEQKNNAIRERHKINGFQTWTNNIHM